MRMPLGSLRVHCELAPVLINRTAVYKMCRIIPAALTERDFRVSCGALLARIGPESCEPASRWQRMLFDRSRRWLYWAIRRPLVFDWSRPLTGLAARWRARGALTLYMDPLYVLFHGAPDSGVVLVYDITTVSEGGWHGDTVGRLYARAFELLARSRCHIVTSCENTADQMRVNWGIAPSRLTVLPLGLFTMPETRSAASCDSDAPFLLFVGQMEPRKNVPGLIRAYAASGLHGSRGIHLRIIGSLPPEDHPDVRLARATPGVDLLGFVDEGQLAASYAQCLAFVYPSFCEGFGLPLLEAMHRGCVCLSTLMGASPEIAGNAALYVSPFSTSDIARGLRQIVDLPAPERSRLSQRARARADLFSWKRFHDGLADVLRQQVA
jgi:glycosyltransferase involved in cell wall biosynthesis